MAAPIFPAFPDAPSRSEGSDDFSGSADAFAAALPPFALKMNLAITWMAETMTATSGYKDAAAASATQSALAASTAAQARDAAQAAVAAATTAGAAQVALAKVQADAAAASATQAGVYAVAAGSAAGFGILGNPGDALIVNANRSGLTFGPTDGLVGDVVISARNPGLPFIPANGGIRARSSAPTLLAVLGLLGGQVGQQFAVVATVGTFGGLDVSSAPPTSGLVGAPPRVMQTMTGGAVNFSADGGQTWVGKTFLGFPGNSISYDEFNKLWLVTTTGSQLIYTSADDGVTWVTITTPVAFSRLVADANGVWIGTGLVANTSVYRSTDGGATWTAIVTGTSLIHAAISTDNKGVWCVIASTQLRRSVDGGLTWTVMLTGTAVFTAISNDRAGVWLVGMGGTSTQMYRSGDNGQSFTAFGVAQAAIQDIAYTQGMFFIVRNVSPQLMIMSASADTTVPTIPATAILASLTKVTATNGYAVSINTANANTLRSAPIFAYDSATQFQLPNFPVGTGLTAWIKAGLKLISSGKTFVLGPAIGSSPVDVDTDNAGVIMTVGTTSGVQTIRRSSDGGQTWSTITSPLGTGPLYSIATNRAGVWVIGGNGALLRSTDNGLTFSIVPPASHGFSQPALQLVFGSNNVLCAGLNSGTPRKSTDGGLTWSDVGGLFPSTFRVATNGAGAWILVTSTMAYRNSDNLASAVSAGVSTGLSTSLTDVKMSANGRTYASCGTTTCRVSNDFGATWADMIMSAAFRKFAIGQGTTVIAHSIGVGGPAQVSPDAGATWSAVTVLGGAPFFAMAGNGMAPFIGANNTQFFTSTLDTIV
ncbi:hypothetical protein N015_08530 [Pseudomonas asturiensis]|uniref:Photosynthesis system II assembly factor Ycf48/Hcf136-like domain-containing protein n=1 Tax=Pseudomonas asturiensis TaxID=1190415 RepID=A0ABX6HA90_9PSED|nr:hypothetical protein [Pseudomonas asturiensis]QHF02452.1 hypothetical protein N015_08530 [Pseudomonas asturiensis]